MKKLRIIFLFLMLYTSIYSRNLELAILEIHSKEFNDRELRHYYRVLQLAAIQDNRHNVLTYEEVVKATSQYKQGPPTQCFNSTCMGRFAELVPQANYILATSIQKESTKNIVTMMLYQTKQRKVIVHYKNRRNSEDISLENLLGQSLRETLRRSEFNLGRNQSKPNEISRLGLKSVLATGILLSASGYMAYQAGQFDPGKTKPYLIYRDVYDDLDFGEQRGFFSLPGISPKYTAMGGAGVALVDDAAAPIMNPAGLAALDKQWIQFNQTTLPAKTPSFLFSYNGPLTQRFFYGITAKYEGDQLANESIIYLSLASDLSLFFPKLSQFFVGTNLKGYLVSVGKIGEGQDRSKGSTLGGGVDLGLQFPLNEKIKFGAILRDLYSNIYHRNLVTNHLYQEVLPPQFTFGFAYLATPSLQLVIDGEKAWQQHQNDFIYLGGNKTFLDLFSIRMGTKQILGQETSRSLDLGFAISAKADRYQLNIDYAFDYNVTERTGLENTHQFGITVGF